MPRQTGCSKRPVEPDEHERWQLFWGLHKLVAEDLPAIIPLHPAPAGLWPPAHDYALAAEGDRRSFADTWIEQ